MIPSFIDGHAHLFSMAKRIEWLDLSEVSSLKELKRVISSVAEKLGEDKWILGFGWDESKWSDEQRYPTMMDLDEASPNNPVFIRRIDGHLAVINSVALSRLQLNKNLRGLRLKKDGSPSGILVEDALEYASKQLEYNLETLSKGLIKISLKAGENGVSMSHETMSLDDLSALFYALTVTGIKKLGMQFYAFILDKYMDLVLSRGFSKIANDIVKVAGIKVFVDGSIGARTAALRDPYKDDPGNRGMLLKNRDELAELFSKADKAKLQLAVHAIGDKAIDVVLDAMKMAKITKELRHRIEHFELAYDEHIKAAKKLGIILSMQPNFVGQWQFQGGLYEKRLGKERCRAMNPFKKIIDNDLILSFGSDCMPFDPIFGIWSAVNHPVEESRTDVLTAIKAYTFNSAYAAFSEDIRGEISIGKRADLVILSHNPLEIDDIRRLKILSHMIHGEFAYINFV